MNDAQGIQAAQADTGKGGAEGAGTDDRSRWLALYVLCTGMLMVVLDATIVNVASLAPTVANPGLAAYAASKAALIAISDAFREEVRDDGVRVAVILPGSTRTSLFGRDLTEDDAWMLDPDDVAQTIRAVWAAAPGALLSRVEVRPLRRKARSHPPRR